MVAKAAVGNDFVYIEKISTDEVRIWLPKIAGAPAATEADARFNINAKLPSIRAYIRILT